MVNNLDKWKETVELKDFGYKKEKRVLLHHISCYRNLSCKTGNFIQQIMITGAITD